MKFSEFVKYIGSQKKMAEHLGVDPSTISRWLSGEKHPCVGNALRIEKMAREYGGDIKAYDIILNKDWR